MPRLESLSDSYRDVLRSAPVMEHDMVPWTPLAKSVADSKLALVTTAGLHVRGDKPFWGKGGDPSFRIIPSSAKAEEIIQSQASIGFDHTGIYRDINVTFPIDRLRELAERGTIGSLAKNYYSFMGATRDPRVIIEETGPEVARLLKDEGVDFVLITPT